MAIATLPLGKSRNWAGPVMLLYCVWSGYKLIFFVSGTFYLIVFFIFYGKLKGIVQIIKKSIFCNLYIFGHSRKVTIFLGFTTYREKIYRKKSLDDVTSTQREHAVSRAQVKSNHMYLVVLCSVKSLSTAWFTPLSRSGMLFHCWIHWM